MILQLHKPTKPGLHDYTEIHFWIRYSFTMQESKRNGWTAQNDQRGHSLSKLVYASQLTCLNHGYAS